MDMQKRLLMLALISILGFQAYGQLGIRININVQPAWGPVGYDHVDYYYLPDIEAYYCVDRREYTWLDRGAWVTTPYLPPRFHDYDLYHGYKVVINEPNPWYHHDRYRVQYQGYRGRRDQAFIRDSRDPRYYANPGHPEYNRWRRDHPNEHRDDYRDHRDDRRDHDEHRDERRDR